MALKLPRLAKLPQLRLPQINHRLTAAAAFGVVCGAALISVQVFGDPAAAGPRGVLSLNPAAASAESAPRLSFADAAAGSDLPAINMELTPIDQLPHYSEVDPESGEVRVAMVEAPEPIRPAVAPLPRAPAAGLTEAGPNGPLPIAARDGRTPAREYSRPFRSAGAQPMIAVVIGGLGFNARATTQAIDELPADVTLSFVPYASNLQSWIDRARARGHEVMLELPMEPFDPAADDTGPQTLLASAAPAQNIARLENLLSRGAGYFGVTNYQGARFATSAQASQPIVEALRRRGLVLISSGIGQRTALSVEAQRAQLRNTAADRIIDGRREAEAIDEQLLNLEALALQNSNAIGAGFAYPVTMEQVARWADEIGSRGYQLAPASAVLNARAATR
jgi:uncharacterized protein